MVDGTHQMVSTEPSLLVNTVAGEVLTLAVVLVVVVVSALTA